MKQQPSKPSVLFLAQRIPYPPNKGDKIRSFNELKYLSGRYNVDVISFVDDSRDHAYADELRRYCRSLHLYRITKVVSLAKGLFFWIIGRSLSEGYFHSFGAHAVVRKLLRTTDYEFIFCFSSQVAQYVMKTPGRKVMDFCDVDSDKFGQYARRTPFPINLLCRLEKRRLARYEDAVNRAFDYSILITPQEAELFNRGREHTNVYVFSNGIDANYFSPKQREKEKAIVFTGEMNYHANVDGLLWFCRRVFPKVVEQIPDIVFYIVGRNPVASVRALEQRFPRNIHVTGFVDDVRDYIARSRMAVIPLRIARGIQNKILEAMAMAVPVVISRNLFESLNHLDERDVMVFDGDEECASLIIDHIDDHERLSKMGRNLREFVLTNHDWDASFNKARVWKEALGEADPHE